MATKDGVSERWTDPQKLLCADTKLKVPLATAALFVKAPDWKQPNVLPQENRQIHCDIFMHQNTIQQGDE